MKTTSQKTPFTSKSFFGFTLIELIVVITILAILGTVGFVAMKNYGANARDSVRITDLKNNLKALALLQIKTTTFPIPEKAIDVHAGDGTLISYQGYLGADISRMIGMNTLSLDPKDKSQYTYVIDAPQKKAQVMGYLESGENVKVMSFLNPMDSAYAADYLDRHIYVAGDMVGVLTAGADKAPLQDALTATGVNLGVVNTTGYVAYFGGDAFGEGKSTGTGDILINQLLGAATNTIPCNPVSFNGYSIGSLSHNETKSFTKPITVSNGSGTGSLSVTCTNGVLNTATAPENTVVSCVSGYVNTGNNLCTADLCGGSIPTKAHMLGSTQAVTSNWTFAASAGTCTFACDSNYTWNGSDTCVANTQTAPACNGSIVPNATSNATATSWTQTWDGTNWNPVYTYSRNATPGICTYDCNVGYTWNAGSSICTINNYTVSGGFWANAANQTVSVCGSSVTADASGNFTTTKPYGTVCNNISMSRSGYTCSTSTNGPASLTSAVSNVVGSCSANACVAGTYVNNTHTYSVPAFESGFTGSITSTAVPIGFGTQSFETVYGCNAGTVSTYSTEAANTPVCNTNYTWNSGSSTCAPNPYTVTYDSNGWNTASPATQTVAYNSAVGTLATITKTGHTFTAWFTALTGGSQITTNTVILGNVTWYARWDANSCSAGSYDFNGHTYSVPAFNSGFTGSVTSAPVNITNGTQTFNAVWWCNAGVMSTYSTEWTNSPVCSLHYTLSGGACVDTTAPTIATVTTSTPACNSVKIKINGSADAVWLHATAPYSFDGWASWQANDYQDFATTSQTVNANQIKVRDAIGNIYTYASSITGTSTGCPVNCVGAWGSCTALCTQTFTVTTAAANGGTACVAANNANQWCTGGLCPAPGTCNNTAINSCTNGTPTNQVAGSCWGSATWNCSTAGGTSIQCSKANVLCPINGACGSDQAKTLTSAPTNLCTAGTPSVVTPTTLGWTWSCGGIYSGTNANCSANKYRWDTVANPWYSCKDILDSGSTTTNGIYWIKPWASAAVQVYCDMTTDGGGWMLIARSNPTDGNTGWGWKGWNIGSLNDYNHAYQADWYSWFGYSTFTEFAFGNRMNINNNNWGPFVYKRSGLNFNTFLSSDTQQWTTYSTIKSDTSIYFSTTPPGMQTVFGFGDTGRLNNLYYMRDCCWFAGYGAYPTGMATAYCWVPWYEWYSGPWCNGSNVDGSGNFVQASGNLNTGGTNQYMIMIR